VLEHPNGWWRDTAQRLLVEKQDQSIAPALRELARGAKPEIPRLHALWTLEGLGALTRDDVVKAFGDDSKRIRNAAVRLAELWVRSGKDETLSALVAKAVDDRAAIVRLQAAATLGEMKGEQAEKAFVALLTRHASQPYVTDASISGLTIANSTSCGGLSVAPEWAKENPEYNHAVAALAGSNFHSGKPARIEPLLAWSAESGVPVWQKLAVLRSVTKPIPVARKIALPETLTTSGDNAVKTAAVALGKKLQPEDGDGNRPLTKQEQDLLRVGTKVYGVYCAQCHQANGQGLPELAPSIADSKWVRGSPLVLAKLVLYGKQDKTLVMPPWGNVLDNQHVAAILTYIRRSWGNNLSPVLPDTIKRARADGESVRAMWTEETLQREAERLSRN
jgi:mono/diheme cytochrome c family protein